jgi:hypothetical protein
VAAADDEVEVAPTAVPSRVRLLPTIGRTGDGDGDLEVDCTLLAALGDVENCDSSPLDRTGAVVDDGDDDGDEDAYIGLQAGTDDATARDTIAD